MDELQYDLAATRSVVILGFIGGLAAVVAWFVIEWSNREVAERIIAIFVWALACFAGGILLGFLFGIPRVLQAGPHGQDTQANTAANKPETRSTYQLLINTNLDDVSDWLTKIVVGVGLVQMREIPPTIKNFSIWIAGSERAVAPQIVAGLVIYFGVLGFMSGYLTTRLFFERAFKIADLAAGSRLGAVTETETVKTTATQIVSSGSNHSPIT